MKLLALLLFIPFYTNVHSDKIDTKIETIIQKCKQLNKENSIHGGLLIAKGNNILYHDAFGESHLSIGNNSNSKFNIASIGKMFTGVAIMQLIENGQLKLDHTIADVLPEYANVKASHKINVEHLLTHTSGIPDIFEIPSLKNLTFEEYKNHSYLLQKIEGSKTKRKPGKKFNYSNSGYVVLGCIIEKLTNKKYEEYMEEFVFTPSQMNSTTGGFAFGGQESTLEDLYKFALALNSNILLSIESTKTMISGKVEVEDGLKYGYGYFDSSRLQSREVSHTGGSEHAHSQIQIFMETGHLVIIYTNNPEKGFNAYQELRQLTRAIFS